MLVKFSDKANKDIKKIPDHIRNKLMAWVFIVTNKGVIEALKNKGFNDEKLKGERDGQRSIRLNNAYTATIYRA